MTTIMKMLLTVGVNCDVPVDDGACVLIMVLKMILRARW